MLASRFSRIQVRHITSLVESQLKYTHLFNPKITPPRQAWVETFVGQDKQLLDIVDLHPRVFGVFPRVDWISETIKWQKSYRNINYLCMPTRNELPGGTRKPWPQKGTGRARHGSVNSPIFLKGGWAHGPRGPVTSYRPPKHAHLVNALRSMLTIKLAQNDMRIVDSLDSYENEDSKVLEDEFSERYWGPSVLIVDYSEEFPDSLIKATSGLNHVNLMTTYGLNTLSLAKHETLVITLRAIREIESKLLHQMMRVDLVNTQYKYKE